MLPLPRITKAVRRVCVTPSHCLIFHQSKHSPFPLSLLLKSSRTGIMILLVKSNSSVLGSLDTRTAWGRDPTPSPRCLQSLFLYFLFYRLQVYPSIAVSVKERSVLFFTYPFFFGWVVGGIFFALLSAYVFFSTSHL